MARYCNAKQILVVRRARNRLLPRLLDHGIKKSITRSTTTRIVMRASLDGRGRRAGQSFVPPCPLTPRTVPGAHGAPLRGGRLRADRPPSSLNNFQSRRSATDYERMLWHWYDRLFTPFARTTRVKPLQTPKRVLQAAEIEQSIEQSRVTSMESVRSKRRASISSTSTIARDLAQLSTRKCEKEG